jgi:hypothetical protein
MKAYDEEHLNIVPIEERIDNKKEFFKNWKLAAFMFCFLLLLLTTTKRQTARRKNLCTLKIEFSTRG